MSLPNHIILEKVSQILNVLGYDLDLKRNDAMLNYKKDDTDIDLKDLAYYCFSKDTFKGEVPLSASIDFALCDTILQIKYLRFAPTKKEISMDLDLNTGYIVGFCLSSSLCDENSSSHYKLRVAKTGNSQLNMSTFLIPNKNVDNSASYPITSRFLNIKRGPYGERDGFQLFNKRGTYYKLNNYISMDSQLYYSELVNRRVVIVENIRESQCGDIKERSWIEDLIGNFINAILRLDWTKTMMADICKHFEEGNPGIMEMLCNLSPFFKILYDIIFSSNLNDKLPISYERLSPSTGGDVIEGAKELKKEK